MGTDIFWKDQTIEEAKAFLQENAEKGTKCPCCDKYVQIYNRKITSSMAYGLIRLYLYAVENGKLGEYLHIEDIFKSLDVPSSIRGDMPKLRFWGLIEPLPGEYEWMQPQNGMYKITDKAISFIRGETSVNASARIYNNRLLSWDKKLITISQALKNKFNYKELMGC